MKTYVVRIAAFAVGSLIAGCVYASRDSAPAKGGEVVHQAVAVYPTAAMTSGDADGDSADVTVQMPMVKLHFEAARYDTSDPPTKVESFYKKALSTLGTVQRKDGGPHTRIEGFVWRQGPGQVTLQAGQTFVAIAPHSAGTEFAIITIGAGPK